MYKHYEKTCVRMNSFWNGINSIPERMNSFRSGMKSFQMDTGMNTFRYRFSHLVINKMFYVICIFIFLCECKYG